MLLHLTSFDCKRTATQFSTSLKPSPSVAMQHDMRRGVTIDVQQWCVVKLCDLCSLGSMTTAALHSHLVVQCSSAD